MLDGMSSRRSSKSRWYYPEGHRVSLLVMELLFKLLIVDPSLIRASSRFYQKRNASLSASLAASLECISILRIDTHSPSFHSTSTNDHLHSFLVLISLTLLFEIILVRLTNYIVLDIPV